MLAKNKKMYFYLKEPKSIKPTPIILVYYLRTEKKYFKYRTGHKVSFEDWDFNSRFPKLKRGSSGKKNKQLSQILNNYKELLEDIIYDHEKENKTLSREILKSLFDKEFKNKEIVQDNTIEGLANCISIFIDSKNKSKGQSKSWNEKYSNLKNKIVLYDLYTNKETKFKVINDDWLDAYCGFLRELPTLLEDRIYLKKVNALNLKMKLPKKPYNDNTLYRHINFLFTFLKWSGRGKYHILDLDKLKNPVDNFQPEDIHLSLDEIRKLEKVEFERDSLDRARDIFLIGIYSGQRFSDYSVFEKEDVVNTPQGEIIIKKSEKMEDYCFIPLHDKLKNLLKKYEWKIPTISSQKFNPHIQDICRQIKMIDDIKTINYIGNKKIIEYKQKCDMVTSHTARRTFITISAEQGMPDHIIMKITGIKDVKTLDKYKKTSQMSVVHFMNKIWG